MRSQVKGKSPSKSTTQLQNPQAAKQEPGTTSFRFALDNKQPPKENVSLFGNKKDAGIVGSIPKSTGQSGFSFSATKPSAFTSVSKSQPTVAHQVGTFF